MTEKTSVWERLGWKARKKKLDAAEQKAVAPAAKPKAAPKEKPKKSVEKSVSDSFWNN